MAHLRPDEVYWPSAQAKKIYDQFFRWNQALPKNGLVAWTSGNVSLRDPHSGYVLIKLSGVHYDQLCPEQIVILDLEGKFIEGNLKPSSDTASHLYIYRHRPDVLAWRTPIPITPRRSRP